jgi:molybdopterin/thiamine biosynthesis adenylyltransferase
MLLPDFGEAGQQRLAASRVLIVGVGALGCGIADQLARAGVGSITLLDRDLVDWTNLQRQTLFDEEDARQALPKAEAARRRLSSINSEIEVKGLVRDLTSGNAEATLEEARPQVILDGTDNFETRYLLNDLSVKHGIPFVYGGAVGTRGMAATFMPGQGPCLRCLFEEAPEPGTTPTCDTAGVLGAAIMMVSSCQAVDAIKILLGRLDLVSRTLLDFDAWNPASQRRLDISKSKQADCPCCVRRRFEFLDGAHADSAALCGQNAVQVSPGRVANIDLEAMGERLRPHGQVTVNRLFARCVLPSEDGPLELTVFPDGRAIVRGSKRVELARSVYARFVGS